MLQGAHTIQGNLLTELEHQPPSEQTHVFDVSCGG